MVQSKTDKLVPLQKLIPFMDPKFARLNDSSKVGAWVARTIDLNQWLQIDLGNTNTAVSRIATQGRAGSDRWVTN